MSKEGAKNGTKPALTSEWGGLSSHLIASFFAVKKADSDDKKTIRWERDMDQPEVLAPLSDANIEFTQNWQSPFENMTPDQSFSSLSAMLQAGGFSSLVSQLQALFPSFEGLDSMAQQLKTLEGKSNLTKLNSTQIFSGMPPVQIPVTAHFRAFKDAAAEVRDPVNQLIEWSLPKYLAPVGPLSEAIGGNAQLFPSEVPQIIGLRYADMVLAPLVMERIPYPMSGPRDRNGILMRADLQIQLASLTAWDRQDWRAGGSAKTREAYGFTR